ncbi:MAG: mechanosensitive ion channel family protein [Arenibacterium sp.]
MFALFSAPLAAQVMLPGGSGDGEETVTTPEVITPEGARDMVAQLSDEDVRALLLERLDAVAAEQAAVNGSSETLVDRISVLATALITPAQLAFSRLGNIPAATGEAVGNLAQTLGGTGGIVTMFALIALCLALALGVEFLARRIIRLPEPKLEEQGSGLWEALRYLARRFFREILGLIVFYIAIRVIGRSILSPEQIVFAAPFVTYLLFFPRIAAAFSRFMMAPHRQDLRLVNVDEQGAKFLHRHTVGLFIWGGFVLFTINFFRDNGIPPGTTFLGFWLDSLIYVYIIWAVWTARDWLRQIMLGSDPDVTAFDRNMAFIYPGFAITVTLLIWGLVMTLVGLGNITAVAGGAHYLTLFWLLAAPVIDTAIRGLVRHLVPPMIGEGPTAEAAYRATKRSYVRIGRVLAIGILAFIITNTWNVSLTQLLVENGGIGDNVFRFLMTAVVGYIVYEGTSLWINRRLAAEQTALGMTQEDADAEMGGASGSRLSTVLPLMLVTTRSAVIVIFGLLAIGNLGVDITPLLAGAGILGLAIGFGAQKLVTDVVSGVFFLVDDAFRTGEYVEIDGTTGSVEKISIRSMQLRHHRGPVHTIPYGEIPKLTNFSRDWVIMKLKFTVPFDTDPNKIKKIFKRIGAEMMEDPLYKDDFLQPFKSQGVFEIDDVGMVIRGKFMAKPGKQFMIRKEIFNKVKAYFEEAGIDFARREVRVAIPGLDGENTLSDEEAALASGAAAAEAVQQQNAEKPA